MFDISWSELLILGVVTLVFVGPKELPVFLRTIGRYAGMVKRQAAEFRTQFDEAMREAEIDQMRKDFEKTRDEVNKSVMDAEREVSKEFEDAKRDLDQAAEIKDTASVSESQSQDQPAQADPHAHDADGLPVNKPASAAQAAEPVAVIAGQVAPKVVSGTPGSAFVPVPPFGKGV